MNIFRLLGQYYYFPPFEPAHRSQQPTSLISRQSGYSCVKFKQPALAEVCLPFRLACADVCVLNVASTGISFRTQALYSTVFLTRYLDLFTTWHSLYNFLMKIFFIGSSLYILYLMKIRFRYVAT